MASINKRWGIAAERWSSVISVQNDIDTEAVFRLIEALTEQGKIKQAEEVISYAEANVEYVNDRNLIESSALIFMAKHQWLAAIECWEKLSKGTICNAKYCICLASSRQFDKLSLLVNDNVDLDVFVKLCLFMANEQWESITELEELESLYNSDPSKVRAECFLIKAHAYNRMSQVDLAHSMLVKYESIIKNNPQCRYEIARLAYATKNWGKLIKQLNINCPDVISLPLEFIKYYLEALTYQGKHQTVDGYLNTLYSEGVYSEAELSSIFMETSLCASILNKLEVAEARLEKCISSFNYCDVTCYTTLIDVTIKQGKLERSSELLSYALKFYSVEEQTLLYKCKAILNMLMHNWSDAILSWKAYSESPADNTLYLLSAAYSHQTDLLRGLLGGDEQMDVFINLLIEFSESNWQEFIDGYTRANEGGYIDLQLFKSILILLASASREIGDYSDAHKYLVSYESLVANDPLCRFEIAKLAFSQNNFNKGLQQLKLTSIDPQWFPTELKEIYLKCLFEKGDHNGVDDELVRFIEHDFTEGCQLLNVLSLESFRDKKWNLAELRYKKYISLQNNICIDEAQNLIFSLIKQNKLAEAESFISSILNSEDDSLIHKVVESRAMLRMAQHRWAEAIKDWRSIGMDNGDNLYYCQCLCWLKDSYLLSEVLNDSDSSLPDYNKIVLLSFIHISNESWQLFILLMKNNGIVDLISEQSLDLGLLILMSMAYRKMNNFDDANKCLVMFESKVKNDIQCRFEITRLSISCKRWSKALAQLNMISSNVGDLPVEFRYYYLYSLFNLGDYLQMSAVFNSLTIEENKCWDFNLLKMKMLMKLERWADIE